MEVLQMAKLKLDDKINFFLSNEMKSLASDYVGELGSDLSTELRKVVYEWANKQKEKLAREGK